MDFFEEFDKKMAEAEKEFKEFLKTVPLVPRLVFLAGETLYNHFKTIKVTKEKDKVVLEIGQEQDYFIDWDMQKLMRTFLTYLPANYKISFRRAATDKMKFHVIEIRLPE